MFHRRPTMMRHSEEAFMRIYVTEKADRLGLPVYESLGELI